jgi:hypothetical protein
VRLRITIPQTNSGVVGGKLRPAYISVATQSAIINVTPQGSSISVSGYPHTMNLTPTSVGCSSSLSSTVCAIALAFAPGSYNVTLTTYDQTGGVGNVLSAAQSVPFTITSGAANLIALTGSVNLGFTLTLNAAATTRSKRMTKTATGKPSAEPSRT